MATENNYPIPVFHYQVTMYKHKEGLDEIGEEIKSSLAFSEVSGLSIEYETITYRDGMSYGGNAKYMPGLDTPVNLTLKKGIVSKKSDLFDWINTVKLNTVEKRDIDISLIDADGNALVTWKVDKAFPKKLDAPSFNANSNEVAIESLELMASNLKIQY